MPISIDFEAIKSMLTHLGHLLLVNDWSLGFCLMVAALNEIFAMLKP